MARDDETMRDDPSIEEAGAAVETPAPEDVSEAREETIENDSLIEAFSAGGRLRKARELKGRTLEDMSSELKINWRVLEALEKTIQPPGYDMRRTRIVARSYASALGIDPEPVVADFPVEEKVDLATAIPKSSVTTSERRRRHYLLPAAAMAGLVIAAGVSAIMLRPEKAAVQRSEDPSIAERVVAVNTAQESLFTREPLKAPAADTIDLSIVARKPAWIEVRGEDGTIFRSRTMARNERYYPRVGAGWTVTVQDGSAFEWHVGEQVIGRLSETSEPVYSASIDQAASEAEEIASPALAATSNSRPSR